MKTTKTSRSQARLGAIARPSKTLSLIIMGFLVALAVAGCRQEPKGAAEEHAGHQVQTSAQGEHEGHEMPGIEEQGEHVGHKMEEAVEEKKGERKILYWQDPMHPQYKSDKPGIAPDCGMQLVPVYADEVAQKDMPPGTIRLSPEKQQISGVRTGLVARRPLAKATRTVGLIEADETQIRHIHTKIAGWAEKIYVNYTGQLVEKGKPLVAIYSPELVSTQQEYLLALKARSYLEKSPFGEISSGAHSLLESTRTRLLYWDITPKQIEELEERGEPEKTLTLHSPITGFVTVREVYEGKYVMPEMQLYTVTDLSHIWLYADIYEYEMPLVRLGQEATITLSYYPGEAFRGQVTYVYPYLEEKTRTNKVRLEFPNPGYKLKPGMYANVELKVDLGERLAIPEEAVMDSGSEQVVFLARDEGHFEPRRVKLGVRTDGYHEVLEGVAAGDKVVTSANFLIDSESRFKAAMAGMGHQHGSP